MLIKIKPDEIVKRCLWDNYVSFIVRSEKEAEKILKENKEFEISERDAFVIGLLKVIETDNLIHKFNTYIVDILYSKSNKEKGHLVIKKKIIEHSIDKFLNKFPEYWEPDSIYKKSLEELKDYIKSYKEEISKLNKIKIENEDYYLSSSIKSLLKFNY